MSKDLNRPVMIWLGVVCVLVVVMVAIGGITRLTGSGLSMVDWRPIMGVVPPLDEEAWQATFDQYRQFPEYRLLRPDMTLPEFKHIFFWEYLHRMVGRLIGLVYLVPFLYFLSRKRLSKPLSLKLVGGFVLGGLQGLLGWYMVKSGLAENPHVSHYRLAAHLGLAFFLFAYLLWILLDLASADPKERTTSKWVLWAGGLTMLIALQIVYGAFMAGLKAGYVFNTFPKMYGRWIPPGLFSLQPAWMNLVQNSTFVQFMHRSLAWLILLGVAAFWGRALTAQLGSRQKLAAHLLAGATGLQFMLGVMTLVLVVPVGLAALHQVMACLLLGAAVFVLHSFSGATA